MRLWPALGAAVVISGGCGGGGGSGGGGAAVPDGFSATWKLRDGRTIPIRRVDAQDGERALRALGGRPCAGAAIYFRATYFDGLAHLAGCATGDGKRMSARFDDNGRRGAIVHRLVREHPPTFSARIVGVGGTPFTVTAIRVGP